MQILQKFTRWHWVGLAMLLGIVTAAYGESWISLNDRWNTRGEAYSHGYLLLVLANWYVFRQRHALASACLQSGWLALPLLLSASLFWLAGHIVGVRIAEQLVLPAIPFLALWAVTGWRAASTWLFPTLLLYTVIPFWDVLTPYLQAATVVVSGALLDLLRIPAHITGLYIQLPAGILQVAEGCAGLSYLLISITLSMIYAYHFSRRWWKRGLLLAVGVLMGLTANWLRVFGIALIAHYSEMQSSMVKDHELFGWVIFAVCLVPFFALVYQLDDGNEDQENAAGTSNEHSAKPQDTSPSTAGVALASTLAITFSLLGPATAIWLENREIAEITLTFPDELNGAVAAKTTLNWLPAYHGSDVQTQKSYWIAGRQATVIAMIYRKQTQGKELISWNNHLADGKQWKLASEHAHGSVNVSEVQKNERERMQVFYWFDVGGYQTYRPTLSKLLQLKAVAKGRQDASLLAIALACRQSPCESPGQEIYAWIEQVKQQAPTWVINHAAR